MNLIDLDEKQVNAVAARIELDLRLGASFTRFQTLSLQIMGPSLADRIISYGMSQACSKKLVCLGNSTSE